LAASKKSEARREGIKNMFLFAICNLEKPAMCEKQILLAAKKMPEFYGTGVMPEEKRLLAIQTCSNREQCKYQTIFKAVEEPKQ
jgi:hypothetical protein